MGYVEFDEDKKFDIIFLGRVAIDFNPDRDRKSVV